MKVLEFSYVDVADPHNERRWPNWSRCYEYEWVLKTLSKWDGGRRLHNTACGTWDLHKDFARTLENISDFEVLNSDLAGPNVYDITKPFPSRFDIVLCISTLEHLPPDSLCAALENLTGQLSRGGLLLCTFDYPGANLEAIECYFRAKCQDVKTRLNGFNGPIVMKKKKFDHFIIKLAAVRK